MLGMVWWVHTEECPDCPLISKLMAAVMALSAVRAITAVGIFKSMGSIEHDKAPAAVGATHGEINAIPAVPFRGTEQVDLNRCYA